MLRDRVRGYQFEVETSESNRSVAEDLEGVLNNAIKLLHTATISSIQAAHKELTNSPDLKKRIEKRHAALESVPEMREIFEKATNLVTCGFIINSGGWFIYILPVLGIMLSITALKRSLDELLAATSYELKSLEPEFACLPA